MSSLTEFLTPAVVPQSLLADIFSPSERIATIVGVALIDEELKKRIQAQLPPLANPDDDPLLDGQSLSQRLRIALRLNIITTEFARFLERLARIRNKYAHQSTPDPDIPNMRDGLINDFFFGIATTQLAQFRGIQGTTTIAQPPIGVVGTWTTPGTPLAQLEQSGANSAELNFRILLAALLGFLADPLGNQTGGEWISITYTYTSNAQGQSTIHSIGLSYV
jgi:hypothetical protein